MEAPEILKLSGIYQIRNKLTNDLYVGSTTRSFNCRWNEHRYDFRNNRNSPRMQRSWNKYGEDSFEFSILEVCKPEQCFEKEQKWADILMPVFNLVPIDKARYGFKIPQETRNKISKTLTGRKLSPERIEKIRKYFSGRKQTPEHIENNRLARVGKFRGEKSPFFGVKGKDHPAFGRTGEESMVARKVICLNNGITYASVTEAAQKLNLHRQSVGRVAKGDRDHHKNFRFKYLEDNNE